MDAFQSKDLERARTQTSFKPASLTALIWPDNRRQLTDELVKIMSSEPILDKDRRRHLSRQELLEHGYAIQLRMIQLKRLHGWDEETFKFAMSLIDDHIPYGLHYNAFIPVLKSQGSDEQIAEWLPRCENLEVIGCYAQTELGHGSNVQGLETVATFDEQSQSFIVDSPTLTSAKWWVGGLGTVANHAVVQAQLFISGKNLGPHLFIVPLRDQKTHKTFPGIQIGDIGPKHYGGFNMNDNGFARFSKVKIPVANFLCRYAKVDAKGHYTPAGHAKIGYGSMVALRAGMPTVLGLELAKCVTIAVRYTTVRRQFDSVAGPIVTDKMEDATTTTQPQERGELQVIKYSSVKERLVPLLASAYCYVLAGHSTMTLYHKMLDALVKPPHDASLLAEVHLLTSGLKAVLSWNVVQGMEESRKALGGHGFSIYSGIGERFAREVPGQTYEGDNYVLVQQTAKGLLKNAQLWMSGSPDKMMSSTQFLTTLPTSPIPAPDFQQLETCLTLLGLRVAALLRDLATRAASEPWSELNMNCVRLTRAFIDHYVAREFLTRVSQQQQQQQQSSSSSGSQTALLRLVHVFVLDAMVTGIPDFAEFGILLAPPTTRNSSGRDSSPFTRLRDSLKRVIGECESDLVGLTDAFGFTDWELNSVLGRQDGDVYRALWRTVNEKNPINVDRVDGVVKSWDRLLKPLHETAKGTLKASL